MRMYTMKQVKGKGAFASCEGVRGFGHKNRKKNEVKTRAMWFSTQRRHNSTKELKVEQGKGTYNSTMNRKSSACKASSISEKIDWGPVGSEQALVSHTPSAAEAARTAVSLVRHGTLCTLSANDGTPFGTHVQYIVDESEGNPIIHVHADSVDSLNLLKDGRCSLYIHPLGDASDSVARVTLAGRAVLVDSKDSNIAQSIRSNFATRAESIPASSRSHDDLVQEEDEVFKLEMEKAYVRRLTSVATQEREIEVVGREDYQAAAADPLASIAPMLVRKWNMEHLEDIVRFCSFLTGATLEELEAVKLLWIDRLGLYIRYQKFNEHPCDVRMGFPQPVDTEKALVSTLTMLGQVTWENERVG